MSAPKVPVGANRLLESLPRKERELVFKHSQTVALAFGEIVTKANERVRHVYFPLTGFVSLVSRVDAHQPLEIGLIGNEGMLGMTLILGVDDAPLEAVVQGAGSALRMSAAQFHLVLRRCPRLLQVLKRYVYVQLSGLAQSIGCSRFHEVEERLSRWLLMTHDRASGDEFHLTHQFLSDMLGVRRSGVTIAAGALQERKLIHYVRGKIRVLNRKGLEKASCACYAALIDDYSSVLA